MATNTYVALDKITVGSAVSNVTFTGINQGYTDLVVVVNGSINAFGNVRIQVGNGAIDSGSNYSWTRVLGDGSTAQSDRGSSQTFINTAIFDTNLIGTCLIHLQNYSNTTTYKTVLTRGNSTGSYVSANVGLWRSTSAIDRIRVIGGGADFNVGTTFSLYGIKAEVGGSTPKATGGTVTSDATYWYHTFTTAGNFVPNQALSCDYLVVAGGGSGGGYYAGGGGGGGVRQGSSLSVTAQNYQVIVGAGGAATTYIGSSGTASSFGSIFATGGGYGSGYNGSAYVNAASGGSGGGSGANAASSSGSGNAGGYSPVEGYAGGTGTGAGVSSGGGGGGAGGAGGNGNSSGVAGAGGIGVASSISGVSTYYAGGGGGNTETTSSGNAGAGGNGGGGGGSYKISGGTSTTPGSGTVNTGGGGGGKSDNSAQAGIGGNGGSGIVIIRYLKA